MRRTLLAIAMCWVGCLHGATELQRYPRLLDFPQQPPAPDGTWLAITTSEFELDTNLPEEEARYAAEVCMREIAALTWGGVSAGNGEANEASRYGYAWAFVHYLIHREPQLFQETLQQIAQGERGIDQLNRELAPRASQIDDAVHAYMKAGEYQTIFLPVKAARSAAQVRRLSADELQQVNALIDAASKRYRSG